MIPNPFSLKSILLVNIRGLFLHIGNYLEPITIHKVHTYMKNNFRYNTELTTWGHFDGVRDNERFEFKQLPWIPVAWKSCNDNEQAK